MMLATLGLLAACDAHNRTSPDAGHIDCMARAMYFESNWSSRDGMIAVGSVVMNRVESSEFPGSVCGVVEQKGQFAPGVMSRKLQGPAVPLVKEAAASVLRGERHPLVGDAQFFHSAGYSAPYNNMHYVLATGGNAFYEKRRPEEVTQSAPPAPLEGLTGTSS
ncbi:cell wall hydrolase [Thalassococcus profundi]|uniref:Cell wall hydrolase n=2 Tax=Thalassococcus profundi TaxID=2282382 RepID=A0A369TNZ9_9RHOB|nr:cell wall hydrolase [Thalassococcus profundi]